MNLTDILTPSRIKIPLTATNKEGVIAELVDVLAGLGDVTSREVAMAAVLDRERTRTTGIGAGLAIPHGKCAAAKKLVMAIGKPASPVAFDSIDGKPVNLVILLVSPQDMTGPHIQALARISRLLSIDALRRKLDESTSAEQMFKAIADREKEETSL